MTRMNDQNKQAFPQKLSQQWNMDYDLASVYLLLQLVGLSASCPIRCLSQIRKALTQLDKTVLTYLDKTVLTQLDKTVLTQLDKTVLTQLDNTVLTQLDKTDSYLARLDRLLLRQR